MKKIVTYLMFDGNCREAMTFYAAAFEAPLDMSTFGEMPDAKPEGADRVMHARFAAGGGTLMASDTMPGMPFSAGNNFSVSVDCESAGEQDRLMTALSEGGAVTMPLQETFWGARFGMLKDRFGIQWMFNLDLPK